MHKLCSTNPSYEPPTPQNQYPSISPSQDPLEKPYKVRVACSSPPYNGANCLKESFPRPPYNGANYPAQRTTSSPPYNGANCPKEPSHLLLTMGPTAPKNHLISSLQWGQLPQRTISSPPYNGANCPKEPSPSHNGANCPKDPSHLLTMGPTAPKNHLLLTFLLLCLHSSNFANRHSTRPKVPPKRKMQEMR